MKKKLLFCAGLLLAAGLPLALFGQSQDDGRPGGADRCGRGYGDRSLPPGRPGMMPPPGPDGFGPGQMGGPGGPLDAMAPDPRGDTLRNLHREADELAMQYRKAGAKDKASAKAALKSALGKLLDAELSDREQLASKLQESAAKARAARDKLIDRRLEELSEEDGWRW